MSDEHHGHSDYGGTHHGNYVKIWAILVVLLIISVLGPTLEIKVVTLITAFGIAVVKAYLVAKNFMHVNVQPKFIMYLMATSLVFMLLFFAGTAPDVMQEEGDNWIKLPLVETAEMTEHPTPH
jgi:caa(3)-type oxidase subunit IV